MSRPLDTCSLWVDEDELLIIHALAKHRNLRTRVFVAQLLDDAIPKSELIESLKEYKTDIIERQLRCKALRNKNFADQRQHQLAAIDKILRDLQ